MINVVRSGSTFFNRHLLYPSGPAVPPFPATKPIPKKGVILRNKAWSWFRPKRRSFRDKVWSWLRPRPEPRPSNFDSTAQMLQDCWFMATMKAIANDKDGRKILENSIQKPFWGSSWKVVFPGVPGKKIYISKDELQKCIAEKGGDAKTRILELAADKFFSKKGNFKSLYLSALRRNGYSWLGARTVFWGLCRYNRINDPATYNPMQSGGTAVLAFFMLAGIAPKQVGYKFFLSTAEAMKFLDKHFTQDLDGASVTISGMKNPLGSGKDAQSAVIEWDNIRTDITSDKKVDTQERSFLNALANWLASSKNKDLVALTSAAAKLILKTFPLVPFKKSLPTRFVERLSHERRKMLRGHIQLLKNAAKKVLRGKLGFIGFVGGHMGTMLGINKKQDTFTYTEPNNPTVKHTGVLSDLVRDLQKRKTMLSAAEPTTGKYDKEL